MTENQWTLHLADTSEQELRRLLRECLELAMHQGQIIEFRKYDSLLKQLEVRVVQAKSIC